MPNYDFEMQQGSFEWHQLRAEYHTASEAPAVMECNPWQPRNQRELAAVARGDLVIEQNWAMTRGKELEPAARDWLNESLDIGNLTLRPCVVTDDEGWLMASLDGLSEDKTVLAEIKIPLNFDSDWVAGVPDGKIPEHYMWQLIHQCAVANDVETVVFCVYDPENHTGVWCLLKVEVLMQRSGELLEAWLKYEKTDHPPLEFDISKNKGVKVAARKYATAKRKAEEAKAAEDAAKKALVELCEEGGPNIAWGLRITPVTSKGRIDYKKVPELDGVDLEPYRGAGSSSMRITGEFDDGKAET